MEYYANTLCISHSELVAGGIIKYSTLRNYVAGNRVKQLQLGGNGREALFAVDSLPLKYRTEIYRRYPDAQEKADSKPFMDSIEPDGKAMMYYAEYVLSDGRHLPTDKQAEYANNCAILNAFGRVIDESNSHRIRQSKPRLNKSEFWAKAAAALPRLADEYPNSLPNNPRRLGMKYNEYKRDGYEVMISKKFQNKNAGKVDSAEKEGLLIGLIAHHNNLDNAFIAKAYNAVADAKGWDTITSSAVGVWREKTDLITSAGRLGVSNFRNHKSMQVKRSRPTAPFMMWTLDGWDVELLYQSTTTDSKGRSVTTFHNRLTIEVVLDPCCNYPIGYAIGTHETPGLIKEALRNAAVHSRELTGEMLRSNQIQCDHYAIKAMTPLYNIMADKLTPARVKNAKSKVIEPYFAYLNKTYCKLFNNWSGYGVTTDPKRQPNAEALNKLRHTFPDEEGVRAQIEQIIQEERRIKSGQFIAMMAQLPAERRLPLSKEQYLLNFGAETGFKNAIEGSGLRPTLLGVKRDYDCFDIRFREHAGERWTVKYDPDDLSEVLAVSSDGTLRFMLSEKYVQPMALADRKEGDAKHLQRVEEFNRQLESHVTAQLAQNCAAGAEAIRELPQADTLHRLLLCDSNGQHKLPKAQRRLKAVDVEAIEVKTVEVPVLPQGLTASDGDDYSIF